jgi:hypothetical protein
MSKRKEFDKKDLEFVFLVLRFYFSFASFNRHTCHLLVTHPIISRAVDFGDQNGTVMSLTF